MQIPLTKKHKMRIERIFSCKRMIAYHYLPQVDYCYIFLLRLCISITPPPSCILPRFVVPSTTRKWKQPQVPFAVQPPDGDRTFPTLSFIASLSPVAWVGTLWDTVRAKKGSSFLSLIYFLWFSLWDYYCYDNPGSVYLCINKRFTRCGYSSHFNYENELREPNAHRGIQLIFYLNYSLISLTNHTYLEDNATASPRPFTKLALQNSVESC